MSDVRYPMSGVRYPTSDSRRRLSVIGYRLSVIGYRSLLLPSLFQGRADFLDEIVGEARLCHEPVAARRARFLARIVERVRGEREDGDVAGDWIRFELARGLPAVEHGHARIHQDQIRLQRDREIDR